MSSNTYPAWNPEFDGVDHINFYTKGLTVLGKLGSNLSAIPLVHPVHGVFASLEGYWYWVATGMQHDILKELTGFDAKNRGKSFEQVHHPQFKELIREALRLKFTQCAALRTLLAESTLPFAHYYVYGGSPKPQEQHRWQLDYLEQLRAEFKLSDRV